MKAKVAATATVLGMMPTIAELDKAEVVEEEVSSTSLQDYVTIVVYLDICSLIALLTPIRTTSNNLGRDHPT